MHKRALILGIALILAACTTVGGIVTTSGASFTGASSSNASASTAGVSDLLHLSPDLGSRRSHRLLQPGRRQPGHSGRERHGRDSDRRPWQAAYRQHQRDPSVHHQCRISAPAGITSITVAISDTDDPSNVINSSGFATSAERAAPLR